MAFTTVFFWNVAANRFQMNNLEYSSNQTEAAVAALADGSYFGVWTDPGEVQGRIVGANGIPLGNEFTVNTPAVRQQFDADMTRLSNGNVVVTYTDTSANANGDIRARLFAPNGSPLASDFFVDIPFPESSQKLRESSVAALSDGKFVVSWTADTNNPNLPGDYDIIHRRFGANFGALDPSAGILIDNVGTINQDIQVAALQDGGFVLAYTDNDGGPGSNGTDVSLQIFNANGSPRTGLLRPNFLASPAFAPVSQVSLPPVNQPSA
jgi:hypothetical protein